jgi:hypothetical protein
VSGFFFLNTHFFTTILRAGQKRSKGPGVFSRHMISPASENKAVSDGEKTPESCSLYDSSPAVAAQWHDRRPFRGMSKS